MATVAGLGAGATWASAIPELTRNAEKGGAFGHSPDVDIPSVIVGDDTIAFRKPTLDLGCCETVRVVDLNRDGRLDIVSGENRYEQLLTDTRSRSPFYQAQISRVFYTDSYLEDLSDLAIDWIFHPEFELGDTGFIYTEEVNRDGLPDLVTSLGHELRHLLV